MQTSSLQAKTLFTTLLSNPLVTPLLRCDLHSTISTPSQERWSETELEELQATILDSVQNKIEKDALSYVEEQMGVYFDEIFLSKGLSDAQLQGVFNATYAGAPSGLLPIPNVAQRVRMEMGISESVKNAYFNPEKYTVAYNAVVLSKLSLLDKDGIRELIDKAELNSNDYPIEVENVVASFIGSLDGHHQWEKLKVPQLPSLDANNCQTYKEQSFNSQKEFLLYKDTEIKDKLFKKLFVGSLAEGLSDTQKIKDSTLASLPKDNWIRVKDEKTAIWKSAQKEWKRTYKADIAAWKKLMNEKDPSWREAQAEQKRQQELGKQEWIYLKDSGKVEWLKAKDKHYENRDAVYDVKSLNFTQECRDAYFPSLTWRKL